MQLQLHPTSVDVQAQRHPGEERVVRGEANRRILGVRGAQAERVLADEPHVAPLSCDGKSPYDVRRTIRFLSLDENAS